MHHSSLRWRFYDMLRLLKDLWTKPVKLLKVSTLVDDVTAVTLTQEQTHGANWLTKNITNRCLMHQLLGFLVIQCKIKWRKHVSQAYRLYQTCWEPLPILQQCTKRHGTTSLSGTNRLLLWNQRFSLLPAFVVFFHQIHHVGGGKKKTPGLTVITWHGAVKGRSKGKTCLRNGPNRAWCLWSASGKEGNALRLLT